MPALNLCDSCQNAKRIVSDRGSVFLMCRKHFDDPAFPKYPRLPVVECRGYEPTRADVER